MSTEVKENDYLVGIWFVGWGTGDWMANVVKEENGTYKLKYRFRYYKNSDAWDGKDEKNWYSGTTTESEDSIIVKMDQMAAFIYASRSEKDVFRDRVIVQGGSEKFIKAIEGKDWVHMKKVDRLK